MSDIYCQNNRVLSVVYSGHNLLNLRLMSQLTSKFKVGLRVTNLADENYAERANFGFGKHRYFVGEPRSLYVQLSYIPGG